MGFASHKERQIGLPGAYAQGKNEEGLFCDPWLRTHQRLGATVLKCVDSTLTIKGTVAEWERWTGRVFPWQRNRCGAIFNWPG